MANTFDQFDAQPDTVTAAPAKPGATAPNPFDRFDAQPTTPHPTAASPGNESWFRRWVVDPMAYVGGKAVAAGLRTFEPAAQAEMAQAGYTLDQTHFDPNVEVFGTPNPQAPGPGSRYAGAVSEAVAGNPMFALLAPESTVLGAVGGQAGGDVFGEKGALIGGAIGGGLGGMWRLGTNSVASLAKSLGISSTKQEAGAAVQGAARDWLTTPGAGFDAAKNAAVDEARNALTSKGFVTQKEVDDALQTLRTKITDLKSDARHISKVADAKTPEQAYTASMSNANAGGTRLSILRTHLGSATDELASAHLMQTPQGWARLSDEAKSALVPDAGMRGQIDQAVQRQLAKGGDSTAVPAILSSEVLSQVGDWIAGAKGRAIGAAVGAVLPKAVRGGVAVAKNPSLALYPAGGAIVGADSAPFFGP